MFRDNFDTVGAIFKGNPNKLPRLFLIRLSDEKNRQPSKNTFPFHAPQMVLTQSDYRFLGFTSKAVLIKAVCFEASGSMMIPPTHCTSARFHSFIRIIVSMVYTQHLWPFNDSLVVRSSHHDTEPQAKPTSPTIYLPLSSFLCHKTFNFWYNLVAVAKRNVKVHRTHSGSLFLRPISPSQTSFNGWGWMVRNKKKTLSILEKASKATPPSPNAPRESLGADLIILEGIQYSRPFLRPASFHKRAKTLILTRKFIYNNDTMKGHSSVYTFLMGFYLNKTKIDE